MHVRMYVCMYVCTYVCICVVMQVCMYVCMHACMYVGMQGHLHVCLNVYYIPTGPFEVRQHSFIDILFGKCSQLCLGGSGYYNKARLQNHTSTNGSVVWCGADIRGHPEIQDR